MVKFVKSFGQVHIYHASVIVAVQEGTNLVQNFQKLGGTRLFPDETMLIFVDQICKMVTNVSQDTAFQHFRYYAKNRDRSIQGV